jgi:hypothetical protein
VETSASFEARYAPPPYPTTRMKQRMKVPQEEKGVAIRSASSLALGIVRYTAKRRQSRRGGYPAEFLFRFLEIGLGQVSVDIVEGHDPEALAVW